MGDLRRPGDLDFSAIVNLAKARPRRAPWERVELTPEGLPVDPTICPWCQGQREDCKKCRGTGLVCPTCRGSRVQRRDLPFRPSYVGCPDCTDWEDQQQHAWDDHNWPLFRRDAVRESAAIRRRFAALPSGGRA